MSASDRFVITIGPYDFSLDRRRLAYRLVDAKSGTVWADDRPVGWVDRTERETGATTRHDLGESRLFSVSERAGANGKEILLGLDLHGIPIDVFFLCTEHEIKLTVEANRDGKAHRVGAFGLLPGLCALAPDAAASHFVAPLGYAASLDGAKTLPIWDARDGLTMPFFGAVRPDSTLALITDSAYATARLGADARALSLEFDRDPERRRLEIRLTLLPKGSGAVAVARVYREKVINDRQHVLLRRKARERPSAIDALLGGALLEVPADDAVQIADAIGIERGLCVLRGDPAPATVDALRARGLLVVGTPDAAILSGVAGTALSGSRWDDLDERMGRIGAAHEQASVVGAEGGADWSAIGLDFWTGVPTENDLLAATVWHDSVLAFPRLPLEPAHPERFLRAVLAIQPPFFRLDAASDLDAVRAMLSVLAPLHRVNFAAFLTAHRVDGAVHETRWSNGTIVTVDFAAGSHHIAAAD